MHTIINNPVILKLTFPDNLGVLFLVNFIINVVNVINMNITINHINKWLTNNRYLAMLYLQVYSMWPKMEYLTISTNFEVTITFLKFWLVDTAQHDSEGDSPWTFFKMVPHGISLSRTKILGNLGMIVCNKEQTKTKIMKKISLRTCKAKFFNLYFTKT